MFILRKYTDLGIESNHALGTHYSFVWDHNKEAFKDTVDKQQDHPGPDEKQIIVGYCLYNNKESGDNILRILKDESVYIMTETGKTFARMI